MAMGPPITFPALSAGLTRLGLGSDVACSARADMFTQMRLLLQFERHRQSAAHTLDPSNTERAVPTTVPVRCAEVLHLATLGGARAVGLEHLIGSITPGKRADLLLTRCDSPRMVPVSDPVAALVMYANASDVDTVFVDGRLRKHAGKLCGVDWPAVRGRLRRSAAEILQRASGCDLPAVVQQAYATVGQIRPQARRLAREEDARLEKEEEEELKRERTKT